MQYSKHLICAALIGVLSNARFVNSAVDTLPNYEFRHHCNSEVLSILNGVHAKCPKITKIFQLSFSVLGQEIWGIILGSSPDKHRILTPEFKYVSTIHGNEVVGKELLLALAVFLCDEYLAGNPEVVFLLMTTRIHLVPILNPDGWDVATVSSYSDRNIVTGRPNHNNVDLNRNFPNLNAVLYAYEQEDPWSNHHLSSCVSADVPIQPETEAIIRWLHAVPFVLSACFHGGAAVANYPFDVGRTDGGARDSATPDDDLFRALSLVYADANPNMRGVQCEPFDKPFPNGTTNGADWYPLEGGMQDYNYLATNCYELTIEMDCVKYPEAERLEQLWVEHLPALMTFMLQVHTGIKGMVTDLNTGAPIEGAIVHVQKLIGDEFVDIWHDVTSNESGDYYRLLLDGTYNIQALKEGYYLMETQTTVYNQPQLGAQLLSFQLQQDGSK